MTQIILNQRVAPIKKVSLPRLDVANRVAEIQTTWDPGCCRYCTSKGNPADLLTRGLSCGDMIASTLWWNGRWQLSSSDKPIPVQSQGERKIAHGCTAVVREPLIDMSRYGTWLKLIRVTAYVLRAVKLFKTKCKASESKLSAEEVKKAEIQCCQWVQGEVYKEDYHLLKSFPRTVAFSNYTSIMTERIRL